MAGWRSTLESLLLREWAGGGAAQVLLRPLSWVYRLAHGMCAVSADGDRRLTTARVGLRAPLVVVGNLTAGGSGKTPCVIALAEALAARGWHPGIVSRGYGGRGATSPVEATSTATEVGDEPLLIAHRTGLPVWVGRDRLAAARALLAAHPGVDVLVSDDGLQHRRLPRDVEVVVVDARRAFGNRRLLPAGPLREPLSRLRTIDQLWICGDGPVPGGLPVTPVTASPVRIALELATHARSLARSQETRPLDAFAGSDVVAVAGIAAPQRFFDMIAAAGIDARPEPWPDHHAYSAAELHHLRHRTVLMTEKDAVKCVSFAAADWWSVPLRAVIPAEAVDAVERDLRGCCAGGPSDTTLRR